MQISPAQRLFSRRTRSLLPMTAALLKPSVSDENVTHTKLHRRQQQQAKYYNRGARDLQPLEPGDTVRVEPWHVGRKEWQKGVVKSHIDKRSYDDLIPLVQCHLTTGTLLGHKENWTSHIPTFLRQQMAPGKQRHTWPPFQRGRFQHPLPWNKAFCINTIKSLLSGKQAHWKSFTSYFFFISNIRPGNGLQNGLNRSEYSCLP